MIIGNDKMGIIDNIIKRKSVIKKKIINNALKEANNIATEYLSFRYLFRNIYGFELESKRLENLIEKFEDIVNLFRKEIKEFIDKL